MDTSIELYLGFDPVFFFQRNGREGKLEGKEQREAFATEYAELLTQHREGLEQVLAGKATVGEAMMGLVYQQLVMLMRHEQKHSSFCRKLSGDRTPLKVSEEMLFSAAGVEYAALDRKQQQYGRGRVAAHLIRLMMPKEYVLEEEAEELVAQAQNTVCTAFARDFIQWLSRYHPTEKECSLKGQQGIGAEGSGPGFFWTVAPYVHSQLTQMGIAPDQSMRKINAWAQKAAEQSERRREYGFYIQDLKPTVSEGRLDSYLGYDERMPTHLGARLQAVELVRNGLR